MSTTSTTNRTIDESLSRTLSRLTADELQALAERAARNEWQAAHRDILAELDRRASAATGRAA